VPIYASGEDEGSLYLAMRYVEGTDLRRLIATEGPLEPERAVAIVSQVASALDAAHRRGLVHRDVKPGNVLLDEGDNAYLADFGLIKRSEVATELTETGQFMGSIEYTAPEQIRGESVDGRADVYSLGCVLHECLTGSSPFKRATEVATLYAHLEEDPPAVGGGLDAFEPVLATAMAKRPQERYASAGELARAARHAIGQTSGEREAPNRRGPRTRAVVGTALVAIVALATIAALFVSSRSDDGAGSGGEPATARTTRVVSVDPSSGEVLETIEGVPFKQTDLLAVGGLAAGEGGVWWGNPPSIVHLDPATGEPSTSLNLQSQHTVPLVAFRTVWVATTDAIERINPATDELLRAVEVPASSGISVPGTLDAGEGALWFVRERALYRIDPLTARVMDEASIAGSSGIAVGEGSVWVIDSFAQTLTAFDPGSMTATGSAELPGSLDAVVVGGGRVWVLDAQTGTVSVIDPATLEFRDTIRVGDDVGDMVYGAGAVWLADGSAGSLSRIDPVTGEVTSYPLGGPVLEVAVDAGTGSVWVLVARAPQGPA
jgi:streptogramin lyase